MPFAWARYGTVVVISKMVDVVISHWLAAFPHGMGLKLARKIVGGHIWGLRLDAIHPWLKFMKLMFAFAKFEEIGL